MALEDFFDHTCDIYHVREAEASPGYGLAASPSFSYEEQPDVSELSCHFGVRSASVSINQSAPANIMDASIKLTLPAGTDIRINDKIVWRETGQEYTAEQPRNIRGHHMFVQIKKKGGQKPL